MEIEKKFLVKKLPKNLSEYESYEIEQGYLCDNPVLRIRKRNDEYILTYKSRIGVEAVLGTCVCHEMEVPLTRESYEHLKQKIDGLCIKKCRYLIPYHEHTIELDVFDGAHKGLILAEVEFSSIEESNNFIKPDWFGENVSDDEKYSNRILSKK